MLTSQASPVYAEGDAPPSKPAPLADGDPDAVTEQDEWAKSVERVAQSYDDPDDDSEPDDEYESEAEGGGIGRSNENLPNISRRRGQPSFMFRLVGRPLISSPPSQRRYRRSLRR
jgi:hypothetical protein